jgi:hypothetical protein
MQNFYLAPEHLDLVRFSGPDAEKLLQGQLTCDVQALIPNGHTRGAACNNKGRVYALFILVRHGDDFFLVFSKGLGAVFAAALKKFLPFYKCTLHLAPAGWHCVGMTGTAASEFLTARFGELPDDGVSMPLADGWLCRLDEARFLLCTTDELFAELLPAVAAAMPGAGLDAWQLCELLAGHFPFTPDDVEKFTPQELQLDRHGYISFSKGCYTGQEIVARMHYRGKAKKQLMLLSSAQPVDLPGESLEIHDETGNKLGQTLKLLRSDAGILYGLAQLPVELAEQPVRLHGAGGQSLSARVF